MSNLTSSGRGGCNTNSSTTDICQLPVYTNCVDKWQVIENWKTLLALKDAVCEMHMKYKNYKCVTYHPETNFTGSTFTIPTSVIDLSTLGNFMVDVFMEGQLRNPNDSETPYVINASSNSIVFGGDEELEDCLISVKVCWYESPPISSMC